MFDFLLRPLRRNFGEDKRFYRAIDDMFGFIPHNIELYKLALIHKSASVVLEDGRQINNERLEFLGDAVIESVTSDYLFIEFPDKNEGFLTQLRSRMVSRQSLNAVAKRLGLDDLVITNSSNNITQKHIYGDAFEAMMGAIYLDQGYDFVNRLLINKIFTQYLKLETLAESETDFKSRLIEWCQKNHHTIHFATSHDKTYSTSHPFFYSKVLIDDIEVGHGAGESKKEAEQRAAFSVSQGFNDADCTKLLDRLDNFDTHISKAESKAESKADSKPIEKSPAKQEKQEKQKPHSEQPKEETKVKTEVVTEKKEQPAEPKETKAENVTEEAKPKASRPRRVTKPKAATTTEEQPQKEESAKNNAQPKSDEQPKKESAPKRTRKATPKSKNVAEVNEKPAEEAQPEANNQTENKPKPRRRRPAKEKAQNAVTTTETTATAIKE